MPRSRDTDTFPARGRTRRTRTLLELCRLLAAPADAAAPSDPAAVLRLADELLLAPALWVALRDGHRRGVVSEPEARRLQLEYLRNRDRNRAMAEQLETAVTALNASDIVPLLFKGSLHLHDPAFPDPGERYQWDLDLAVPAAEFERARSALMAAGYRPDPGKPFLHPHELPLAPPRDRDVPLELHAELGSAVIQEILPLDEIRRRATPLNVGRGRALALSPTDSLAHNVLHAQAQDLGHAVYAIALRQLHTATRLLGGHAEQLEWPRLTDGFRRLGLEHLLSAYLHQARALVGAPVPPLALSGRARRARLHHLLCLVAWELRWPSDILRNLRYAFGTDYLRATYEAGQAHAWSLRARHAATLLRTRRKALLEDLRVRRV